MASQVEIAIENSKGGMKIDTHKQEAIIELMSGCK